MRRLKRLCAIGILISMAAQSTLVGATENSDFETEKPKQEKTSKYGYIPPAELKYAKNPKDNLKRSSLPSKFGSLNKPVRNQNPFGTCWAFAGTGIFEYAVDKQHQNNSSDFSEEHMIERLSEKGSTGYQINDKSNGGNEYMYAGYFASGFGPVQESLFPYRYDNEFLSALDSIFDARAEYRTKDIQFFDTTCTQEGTLSEETKSTVKTAIYNYGAASCGIAWYDSFVQSDQTSFICTEQNAREDLINHEITIVGWDDSYSKDHFEGNANKNGAWLIRNSWGNGVGDQGYFWVSYEDTSLLPSCTIRSYDSLKTNETIYNLDDCGALYPEVMYRNLDKAGFINVFSITNPNQVMKEVTFYESETNASYQIYYIPVSSSGELQINQKKELTSKKTVPYPGYHTVTLDNPINVTGKAAIMVEITSNHSEVSIGAEGTLNRGSQQLYIPTIHQGESYVYVNGTCNDIFRQSDFGNWSIKLVTETKEYSDETNEKPATEEKKPTPEPTSIPNPTPQRSKITYVSNPSKSTYSGKTIKKSLTVKSGSRKLTNGKDYTITYSGNKNCGRAKMTIKGKGNYTGTYTRYFYIYPKKAALKKLKAGKKKLTVYLKKSFGGVTGYQIRYSLKKNFKGSKYKTSKKSKYTIKKLKKKKTYYVKIRAYKTVGGKKLYGSWSKYKKIKVK